MNRFGELVTTIETNNLTVNSFLNPIILQSLENINLVNQHVLHKNNISKRIIRLIIFIERILSNVYNNRHHTVEKKNYNVTLSSDSI